MLSKQQNHECRYSICDTAGRLQNKVNLMKELEKVKRVIEREIQVHHMKYFLFSMQQLVKMR